jgi:GDP-4-dehydro-6-deoxy-D-mannose reductase
MKALVTGIDGFVGPYLATVLKGQKIDVVGTFLENKPSTCPCLHMDVTNPAEVTEVIRNTKPDLIFHLAGFSSVAASFTNQNLCTKVNVDGTRNLLDAVITAGIKPRILVVSSAEVYGKPNFLPITEKHPLQPLSPYAASRIEQERICGEYVKEKNLHIVITRSFNHSGPHQSEDFVLPSFAKQIILIERGKQDSIKVGNLDAIRDFSHVRDVVNAYWLLSKKGQKGDFFNVCSGKGHSIKDCLTFLINHSTKKVTIQTDSTRLRSADIPVLVGDNHLLRERTGWTPSIPIEKMLEDILDEWRAKLNRE